jgi:hypothetical protein
LRLAPIQPRSFLERLRGRLAAARGLAVSLLVHAAILLMAGSMVIYRGIPAHDSGLNLRTTVSGRAAYRRGSDAVVRALVKAPVPVTQPAKKPEEPKDVIAKGAANHDPGSAGAVLNPNRNPPAFEVKSHFAANPEMSSAKLPPGMETRVGGSARAAASLRHGGTEKSERAVNDALRWLARQQHPDGSWAEGHTYQAAMTGLALLCLVGHGETTSSVEFGTEVKRSVEWFADHGLENHGRLSMEEERFSAIGAYAHAIGAYALSDYYTLTKDDRVRVVLIRAIEHIVEGQAPDGGWNYAFAPDPESNTSVTGWQIQALRAAVRTGLEISGVEEALDKAMTDLERVQGPNGGFGYRAAGDSYSLAGVGTFGRACWRGNDDRVTRDGIRFILAQSATENLVEYDGPSANLYAWYYNTEACFLYGGEAWARWNRWFQDEIADHQSDDGSWPVPAHAAMLPGPQQEPAEAGPIYRTALCTLMLESYYRSLAPRERAAAEEIPSPRGRE